MANVVIYFDHLEYFTAIWKNLWPFVLSVDLWHVIPLWYVWTKKNLATQKSAAITNINFILPKRTE
jgi:hypothetical protein